MNNFRTIILILVSVIQISAMITNINWESLQLTEFTGKGCKDIKHENSSKIAGPMNDLQLKKEDFGSINSPICRKETPLKSTEQPAIISNKNSNPPVVKVLENNELKVKKSQVMNQIIFNGTVDAELF
jgi:hypothetical protein